MRVFLKIQSFRLVEHYLSGPGFASFRITAFAELVLSIIAANTIFFELVRKTTMGITLFIKFLEKNTVDITVVIKIPMEKHSGH